MDMWGKEQLIIVLLLLKNFWFEKIPPLPSDNS